MRMCTNQTGLDAFTAHKVVEILADLAANGKTVILSIHQVRPCFLV